MSTALGRGIGVIELLVGERDGLAVGEIASSLGVVKSSAHRTLTELVNLGYVRQDAVTSRYVLGLQIVSLGQRHLSQIPLVDPAQAFLDRLAASSGELSRLSIVDEDTLIWVAKSEGGRSSLRLDPDAGKEVKLSCSASGLAWLMTMDDQRALELLEHQGYADSDEYGPNAPRSAEQYLQLLRAARELGFGHMEDSYEIGVAAVAVPVTLGPGQPAVGVLNLSGPSARLTKDRCVAMVPELQAAAQELSTVFRETHLHQDSLLS